jgi:hypothetical protein
MFGGRRDKMHMLEGRQYASMAQPDASAAEVAAAENLRETKQVCSSCVLEVVMDDLLGAPESRCLAEQS